MNDSVGALLAIFVMWVILRFAFGGSSSQTPSAPRLNNARSRPVPQHMVDSVKALFPHVPEDAIRYDLQRSGSAEATCDRILNEGGLPTPPAGLFSDTPTPPPQPERHQKPSQSSATLISRFGSPDSPASAPAPASGWADSPEERAKRLQERKRQMVLDARKRMLQKTQTASN